MEPGNRTPVTEIHAEKLVEIVTKDRLCGHLDKRDLFGMNRYGYCKGIFVIESFLT